MLAGLFCNRVCNVAADSGLWSCRVGSGGGPGVGAKRTGLGIVASRVNNLT